MRVAFTARLDDMGREGAYNPTRIRAHLMQRALRTDTRSGPKIFEERGQSTGDPAAGDGKFLPKVSVMSGGGYSSTSTATSPRWQNSCLTVAVTPSSAAGARVSDGLNRGKATPQLLNDLDVCCRWAR